MNPVRFPAPCQLAYSVFFPVDVAMIKRSSACGLRFFLGLAGAFSAAVLLLASAVAQEAAVYRWVDSAGVVHYSDQPAADRSVEELPLRYRKTDRGAVQARLKAKSELDAAANLREMQQAEEASAADADREKVLAERADACKAARERMAKYTTAHRLYRPGADGERQYLSDEELDVERANAARAVERDCS